MLLLILKTEVNINTLLQSAVYKFTVLMQKIFQKNVVKSLLAHVVLLNRELLKSKDNFLRK
jgi:hypothetical protein